MGKAPILPSGHLCVTFTKNLLMDPQPANPIPPKTDRNLNVLGAAAQRAAVRLLAVICASATRHLLQQLLPDTAGLRCLHWGCGSGEETFLLSSLLTEESSWWAIDEDPVLIEAALQQEARHSGASVHFAQSFLSDWRPERPYDIIFSGPRALPLPQLRVGLADLQRLLKKGGALIVAAFPFSGWRAYPYNYAFASAVDLIGRLEESRSSEVQQLPELLKRNGFTAIETLYAPPAFIPRTGNRIASLFLESCREEFLQRQWSNREELNALLEELREFEQREDTLVSRPGVHLMLARKT